MISVPLRQFLDALVLGPVPGSAAAPSDATAPAGAFSTILSGASVTQPTTLAHPSAPASSTSPQPQPEPKLPELDNGQAQTSLPPAAEIAAPSSLIPSPADADDNGLAAVPAKLLGKLLSPANKLQPARSCDPSSPATDPKLAAAMGSLQSALLPKLAKRSASNSKDTSKPADTERQSCELNPALLTIQQALVAAASLSPSCLSGQPDVGQAEQKSPRTAVISLNELAAARGASPLPDAKPNSAEPQNPLELQAPSQGLQSHDLASVLDQQLLQPAHRSDAPRSASAAPLTIASPEPSQASDLHQLDALVRDIAEVSGTSGRAALRLTAEQLGNLEIKLHRSDEGISVTIRTESEQAHSTVAQAQQQLADDMRANGLKLTATSVMLGHGGAGQERQDRQGLPFAKPIEAAASESEASETSNDERPDGRYA